MSNSNNTLLQNNLVGKDAILKRKEWMEMARMLGHPGVKYQYILDGTKKYTIHSELEATYSDFIPIPMIWMQVPDQETATTLGWVPVLQDDRPYLVQLPYDTPYLQVGCRLMIPFVGDSRVDDESGEGKIFRITRVYGLSRYPNCRMCQLAPELESKLIVDQAEQNLDRNYKFIKVDQND